MADIGWAVGQMRAMRRVAREGWNGKGMWVGLAPGEQVNMQLERNGPVMSVQMLSHVVMFTAQGELVPWVCSQTDLLAFDWVLVDVAQADVQADDTAGN